MELIEAKRLALELVSALEIEWVELEDGLGRVLAQSLASDLDIPGESRSRLDGYAVQSADTAGASARAPVVLKLMPGLSAAGHAAEEGQRVGPGECLRILTGAPVPPGADAVIAQEEVVFGQNVLIVEKQVERGRGVALRGEEIRAGEPVLAAGDVLTPTRLALVAGVGVERIPVYRRPRVALLATGDEIKELGQRPDGPSTFCNNRRLLAWLVRVHGGVPIHLGIAKDDARALVDKLGRVDADLVITTGGIGRGDRDFVLDAWGMLGVRTCFRQINLAPGKNSALGQAGDQVFFALPGSPWGARVVFEVLVAPMLRRRLGLEAGRNPSIAAILEKPLKKRKGVVQAVRGSLDLQASPPSFYPRAGKDGALFADLRNNFAYTLLEAHVVEMAAGSLIRVHLNDFPLLAAPTVGFY
jgi:molybdopterin molybdotransferase